MKWIFIRHSFNLFNSTFDLKLNQIWISKSILTLQWNNFSFFIFWNTAKTHILCFQENVSIQTIKNNKSNEFIIIQNVFQQKFESTEMKFSNMIDFAFRNSRCCEVVNFKICTSRDNCYIFVRFRLKCTICRRVYKNF